MKSAYLTDAEVAIIDRAVVKVGGGALLRAELVMWSCAVKETGTAWERDTFALFMAGKLRPLAMLDGDGQLRFVPTQRPHIVIVDETACRDSALCILDDGHDGEHRFDLGSEVR